MPGPRASLDAYGNARHIALKKRGRPLKMGPRKVMKTDVTLPPGTINRFKAFAELRDLPVFQAQRLAIKSYAKHCILHPIEPEPTSCPTCGRPYRPYSREPANKKRLRVTMNLDQECVDLMTWIATTRFHGTFSRAFEAAVDFFMDEKGA